MAQRGTVLSAKQPEFDPQDPHDKKRDLTSAGHPLTTTRIPESTYVLNK